MYANGDGVVQDNKEAVKWYRLAAEQGNSKAQVALGYVTDEGAGVAQKPRESVKQAEQSDVNAQFNKGMSYYNGLRVAQNHLEAVKWLRLAADQGHSDAQYNLGYIYYYGKGVVQDYVEADKWYRLAAEQGNSKAQVALGYVTDEGAEENSLKLLSLLNLGIVVDLEKVNRIDGNITWSGVRVMSVDSAAQKKFGLLPGDVLVSASTFAFGEMFDIKDEASLMRADTLGIGKIARFFVFRGARAGMCYWGKCSRK
jgi:TPR repeat protein